MEYTGIELSKDSYKVSAQIDRGELQKNLLQLLLRYTEAQYACILLTQGDKLLVSGTASAMTGTLIFPKPKAMRLSDQVPSSITESVQVSGNSLVIGSAIYHPLYRHDNYVKQQQPLSIMVIPIKKNGDNAAMQGMVYLENNRTAAAFESRHLDIAQCLCLHAAFALENIQIFDTLHQKIKRLEQKLYASNTLDNPTQVVNREYFDNHLLQEWRRSVRDDKPLALLLCQIDHIQRYKKQCAPILIEEHMKHIAMQLQDVLQRPGDIVGRYDDDSFAMLLPSTESKGAIHIAKRVQEMIKDLNLELNQQQLSMSVGIACVRFCRESLPEALLVIAEDLLHKHPNKTSRIEVESF